MSRCLAILVTFSALMSSDSRAISVFVDIQITPGAVVDGILTTRTDFSDVINNGFIRTLATAVIQEETIEVERDDASCIINPFGNFPKFCSVATEHPNPTNLCRYCVDGFGFWFTLVTGETTSLEPTPDCAINASGGPGGGGPPITQ